MDRLSQAEAVLDGVGSRDPAVLLPGRVTSPMDCQTTTPVSRAVIDGCQQRALSGVDGPAVHAGTDADLSGVDPVMDREMLRLSAGTAAPDRRRDSA